MTKNCKVISTCFNDGRSVRLFTTLCGVPKGLFNHSQNFPTKEKVKDLVTLNIKQELTVPAGVNYDTIIVNNNTSWSQGNKWLDSLNGIQTKNGKLIIEHRENYGRAFGGYNFAFEKYRDKYENWIFTEDDVLVNGNNFYLNLLKEYEQYNDIGLLSIIGISTENFSGVVHEDNIHAHGSIGLFKTNILDKIYKFNGNMLPHAQKSQDQSYSNHVNLGEIAFSNTVKKIGMKIYDSKRKYYNFAYDFIRNINKGDIK